MKYAVHGVNADGKREVHADLTDKEAADKARELDRSFIVMQDEPEGTVNLAEERRRRRDT